MASDDSRLRVRKESGVIRAEFVDRNILDEANIQAITDELLALVANEPKPKLLISFANVDHLSVPPPSEPLITIHNKMKGLSGQLRLADIDPQIYEVFEITKLNKLFQIHETSDEAAASFA